MLDEEFLSLLQCPESGEKLSLADDELVERLNALIGAGELLYRDGRKVEESLSGGLVREDGTVLYPIFDDIPILLVEESIGLGDAPGDQSEK